MKKLISLVLCIMMISSLFAMNASASVVTGANTVYLVDDSFEGKISDGYTFANVTEATEEDGNSYYEVSEWLRAYAQPVAYPESGAYMVEFDSKFVDTKGEVAQLGFYILDKTATAAIADNVATSMDFYVRGDVNPEAKGIDTSKWYSFRVTIDSAAGITYNGFHGRLQGDGIKLEWKEKGTAEWKTAVNDLYSYASGENLENDFGGENLKYYVGRNIWQYVNSSDMESDGFGIGIKSYLDNFKIRQNTQLFTGAKYAEDEDGFYTYSDASARPYLQPVNYPESGLYTIEFDSKFSNTVDGAAQVLTVYLLDPALTADIADVASSIDFNIQGSTDSEAKGIDINKWYSFKITIDKSKGITFNGYYGRLQGNGIMLQWKERGADEWITAVNVPVSMDYTGSDLKYYVSRNYWQYVNGSDLETPGFGFQTRTYLDNLTISYPDPIPATGVLYTDDFEGATTFATGIATVGRADGNNYLALKGDGSSWAGSGQATATEIPENFILTMDVYMEKDNAQNLIVEYWQSDVATSGVWGQVGIAPADVEAGKWYTLKIAKIGEGRSYTASLEDKESGEVKAIAPVSLAVGITGNNPGKFMFRGWKNDTVLSWRVDNIVLTEAAAASLPAINATADEVAVTVSADAISETVAPVLALYKENRLVDVDWDAKAAATDGVSAELTATGEYDEAVVFVWDGFENCTPLLEAWDITDIIAE